MYAKRKFWFPLLQIAKALCIKLRKATNLEIILTNRKLRKLIESEAELIRKYGARMTKVIMKRMSVLKASDCLATVPTTKPERCHQLSQDRDEQFAVDLVRGNRLIFEVGHESIPRKQDGGIDKNAVTKIRITEIRDYHRSS